MAFSTDFTRKSGVFYRFNANNWRFSVYILFSKNFARVKKMTNIRYGLEKNLLRDCLTKSMSSQKTPCLNPSKWNSLHGCLRYLLSTLELWILPEAIITFYIHLLLTSCIRARWNYECFLWLLGGRNSLTVGNKCMRFSPLRLNYKL